MSKDPAIDAVIEYLKITDYRPSSVIYLVSDKPLPKPQSKFIHKPKNNFKR